MNAIARGDEPAAAPAARAGIVRRALVGLGGALLLVVAVGVSFGVGLGALAGMGVVALPVGTLAGAMALYFGATGRWPARSG